jgi:hypothetical protein
MPAALIQTITVVLIVFALNLLWKVVGQFRTDSGSSLKEVLNRLETAAALAARDREWFTALLAQLIASGKLDELGRERLAEALTAREEKVDIATSAVAADLIERQRIIDKLSTGIALDLTERQRLIDLASAGAATDLTAREEKVDTASERVAEDLAAKEKEDE